MKIRLIFFMKSTALLSLIFFRVGRPDATQAQDIVLSGTMILNEHCILENISNETVELRPCSSEAMCYVNGKRVEDRVTLKSGDRVIFGKSHVFRYINPEQVRKEKSAAASTSASMSESPPSPSTSGVGSSLMSDSIISNNNGNIQLSISSIVIKIKKSKI